MPPPCQQDPEIAVVACPFPTPVERHPSLNWTPQKEQNGALRLVSPQRGSEFAGGHRTRSDDHVSFGQELPLALRPRYSNPMKEANSSTGMRGMLIIYSTELVSA